MRGARRLLSWLLGLPLLALLLTLLAAGFAISTETGLRGLLALAERAAPGQLSVGAVSGRLLGPLRVENLRYQDGPLQLALADAEIDWQPNDLLSGKLNVTRLHFNGLDVQLPPGDSTPSTPKPLVLPDIRLPLAVNVSDLQGRAIRIQLPAAAPIQFDAINFKARTEADGLSIETLEIRAPQGAIGLSGRLNPVGAYPVQITLDWRLLTPNHGAFSGRGEITGELRDRLQLTHNITGAATLELHGEVRQPLTPQPAWSAQAQLNVADLKPFAPELAGKPLTAQLDAQGVLTQFQGQGEIAATLPELGPATLRFTASGNDQGLKLDQLRLTAANRPLTLTAGGEVQFAELRFDAGGQWQSLVWPLTGSPQVESAQGEFAVKGAAKDYQFQLAAEVQGPDVPRGRWTLRGQGSDQAVREVKLSGQTLEGAIEGNANVAWLPAVRWQAALTGTGLNPGAQWPDVPGKLNVRLKSEGVLEPSGLKAHALIEELAGTLSGQELRGNAEVAIQGQNLMIKTLRLNAGDARLEAEGALTQRWDVRWKLDAPQLQGLVPGLSGAIASSGALSGSRDRPAIAASFTVQKLRRGDTQIQQLRGEANVDVSGASRSQLKVTGDGLMLGGQNWKSFTLDGSGTPSAHDLKAELVGDPGRFLLALAGSLQTPSLLWQGRITQLSARDTVAGAWNLDQPAAARTSNRQANLDAVCLSSAPTRICVQGQWDAAGGFKGRLQLSNLAPERFKSFLPPGLNLATNVSGDASVSGNPGGALQGKLNLSVAPGRLQMEANGQPIRFTLNGGSLQSDLNGRNLNAQVRLDLAQTGQLQANLKIQDPFAAAQINGKVNAAITDLGVASLFAPQLQKVSGQLKADVSVSGALSKPTLRGEIRLENAGAAIPEAGITLQNLQFTAASNGQGPLQLSGSVRSGPGQLQLSGEVEPLKPQLSLSIKGQNFQALDTADIRIQLSPDLKLDIAQQQVRVEGELTVPQAYLRPVGNRPGAIQTSDDVVMVNGRNGATTPPKPRGFEIYAKVRVILGDEVQVETPAFKGKLKGRLLVEETPQLAPRGSGSIEVVAGNYRIYGEEIQIQRGQLLFSSSPLDNPGLDLRVARQTQSASDPITAGAQIRGTLKKPQMTLFSEPKMPDADILSYLVLGRSPQSGGSESALLFKAASAMGLGGGALTKSLGDAFGLDSLQLGSGSGDRKDTSLMLGKYLSPDLYVGYGVGLLNAVNTFNVKYRISKRLMFESNSSAVGAGADLIYTIER
ncbi:MAG TPA: translocation/assembly module TamB domain-containing protein [Candidatus Contendobacter sp.]|nr:translocation/assembly module TamB domain-containing protein [Candidatus Contendobacter sp.]HRD49357.1 translocation/assembly module TamB domain-containing protein [Candidatus Contendobacter sp.]